MNLNEAFAEACARYAGNNFDELSGRDKILVTVWGLEADVNNGGFEQYYFNGSGDQAWFAPTALKSIGAHRAALIVERANALFGESGPSPDRDERLSALVEITDASEDAWDSLDKEFYEYPDDIAGCLVAHFGLTSTT